ncbi:MAG: YegP family protein [Haloferacaceae archaeon]
MPLPPYWRRATNSPCSRTGRFVPRPKLRSTPEATFEVEEAGERRWRLVHDDGTILADSGDGYARRQNCERGSRASNGLSNLVNVDDPTSIESGRVGGVSRRAEVDRREAAGCARPLQ